MREFLEIMLTKEGYRVQTAVNGKKALDLAEREVFDLAIIDIRMPKMDGIETLIRLKEISPETVILMITAYASTDTAIRAMKQGAYDYITKPFKIEEIKMTIQKALEKKSLEAENTLLRQAVEERYRWGNIIGKSDKMREVFELIEKVSPTKTNVLLSGESGTGKELVAKAVHYNSPRKNKPFIVLNCGAIPENLLESELFGHMRGAFTGAIANKRGLFEAADGGTIFLDEIGELPLPMQVKLLRVIQDREFTRVGGTDSIRVDVRIISATNKDIEEAVRKGEFREDLFYRLNVIQLKLPNLRERKEDIPLLAQHFLKVFSGELGKNIRQISPGGMKLLMKYDYPGNVRELQNMIERAVALEGSNVLTAQNLSSYVDEQHDLTRSEINLEIPKEGIDLEKAVENLEKTLILKALEKTRGVKKRAAELLHINFRSMRYRLEKYQIDNSDS
ncbi:MAG: response regulator [Proteobacteria bacterium]|nr:response regulator [Pseudomonadota bacterium]NIS70813.1 response regulator [Pseudomonadota bacterium]